MYKHSYCIMKPISCYYNFIVFFNWIFISFVKMLCLRFQLEGASGSQLVESMMEHYQQWHSAQGELVNRIVMLQYAITLVIYDGWIMLYGGQTYGWTYDYRFCVMELPRQWVSTMCTCKHVVESLMDLHRFLLWMDSVNCSHTYTTQLFSLFLFLSLSLYTVQLESRVRQLERELAEAKADKEKLEKRFLEGMPGHSNTPQYTHSCRGASGSYSRY